MSNIVYLKDWKELHLRKQCEKFIQHNGWKPLRKEGIISDMLGFEQKLDTTRGERNYEYR